MHITGFGPANVAHAVAMGDGAFTHVADDLQVGVSVQAETRSGSNLIVVQNDQRSQRMIVGIALGRDPEMVLRLQPPEVSAIQAVRIPDFQHSCLR
jgi:hypothetical protein